MYVSVRLQADRGVCMGRLRPVYASARTHACTHVFVCACQSVCVCMHVQMHACICTYAATKSSQELSLKRAEL